MDACVFTSGERFAEFTVSPDAVLGLTDGVTHMEPPRPARESSRAPPV
ncbi:hypothetical protein [Streptomyces sp. NPDC041003]